MFRCSAWDVPDRVQAAVYPFKLVGLYVVVIRPYAKSMVDRTDLSGGAVRNGEDPSGTSYAWKTALFQVPTQVGKGYITLKQGSLATGID